MTQKIKKGDKIKTQNGDIETVLRVNSNGNIETSENDYSHNPATVTLLKPHTMTQVNKHTQGEWQICNTGFGTPDFISSLSEGGRICTMSEKRYSHEEQKANARLIAAAPELLEALNRCKDWFYLNYKDLKRRMPPCLIEAELAITKATK